MIATFCTLKVVRSGLTFSGISVAMMTNWQPDDFRRPGSSLTLTVRGGWAAEAIWLTSSSISLAPVSMTPDSPGVKLLTDACWPVWSRMAIVLISK
jgi:hypothetical protein